MEHDGFRLLVDCGYATVPRLLEHMEAHELDAVFISHGHPDHCADLNPLLRARALGDYAALPLPVYTVPSALDAVLALDRPGMLADAYLLKEFAPGSALHIGPFACQTSLLPHWLPNAGLRLMADELVIAYTGDTGPSPDIAELGRDADLLVADATFVGQVPEDSRGYLSSAPDAASQAMAAGARRLLLTHLLPGTDQAAAETAAAGHFAGLIAVATPGLVIDLP
jgi:ribonuclease BN (tRNA processing enzyme)